MKKSEVILQKFASSHQGERRNLGMMGRAIGLKKKSKVESNLHVDEARCRHPALNPAWWLIQGMGSRYTSRMKHQETRG